MKGRWLPVALGAVVALVVFALLLARHNAKPASPGHMSPYEQFVTGQKPYKEVASPGLPPDEQMVSESAAKRGLDPDAAVLGIRLMKKAEKAGDLSDADWAATKALAKHPEETVAGEGLSVMMHLAGSAKRDEAIAIGEDFYKSKTGHLRRTALILLYHLNAPDWRQHVDEALNSSDPDDREVAAGILRRDSGLPPTPHQ